MLIYTLKGDFTQKFSSAKVSAKFAVQFVVFAESELGKIVERF